MSYGEEPQMGAEEEEPEMKLDFEEPLPSNDREDVGVSSKPPTDDAPNRSFNPWGGL